MASKILRSGNTPLRNLINRHLRPNPTTITAAATVTVNQPGTITALYNRNYLFPPTFGPRVELNQVVIKPSNGNQFALWAFPGLDHQSGVQVHCSPKKKDSDYESDGSGKSDLDDDDISDFDSDADDFSDSPNVNDSDVE